MFCSVILPRSRPRQLPPLPRRRGRSSPSPTTCSVPEERKVPRHRPAGERRLPAGTRSGKTGRLVVRIDQARELFPLPDGRVLVSSRARVLALNLRTRKTTLDGDRAELPARDRARAGRLADGSKNVMGSEQTTLVRIRGGTREVLGEFHGVHGILVTAEGLILSESYGGRVLHFDPETKAIEVLAGRYPSPPRSPRRAAGTTSASSSAPASRTSGRTGTDDRCPGPQTGPDRVRLAPPAGRRDAERDGAVPDRPRPGTAALSVGSRRLRGVIRDELGRLWRWEERHRRLVARLSIALALTVVVDVVGLEIWALGVVAALAGSFSSFFASADRGG